MAMRSAIALGDWLFSGPILFRFAALLLSCSSVSDHPGVGEHKSKLLSGATLESCASGTLRLFIHENEADVSRDSGSVRQPRRTAAIGIDGVGTGYSSRQGRLCRGEVGSEITGAIGHKTAEQCEWCPQRTGAAGNEGGI